MRNVEGKENVGSAFEVLITPLDDSTRATHLACGNTARRCSDMLLVLLAGADS